MKRILLILALFLTFFDISGQNLLINGDFETGFGSGFNVPGLGYNHVTVFTGNTLPGDYAVIPDPVVMNSSYQPGGDHTPTGPGNMLVVDGNLSSVGPPLFWEAGTTPGGTICGLTIGKTYIFSYWIKSLSPVQADIRLSTTNVTSITLVSGSAIAPLPAAGWQQVVYSFVANAACIHLGMWDNDTTATGNDFAVDDLSLTAAASISVNNNSVCQNSAGTLVTFLANIPNATSFTYNVNSGASQTATIVSGNTATVTIPTTTPGTFNYNLLSVTYGTAPVVTVPVVDAVSIVVNPLPTATISGNVTICSGAAATVIFTGTANASVTYQINSGSNQTIVLDSSGTAILTNNYGSTANFNLISVTSSITPFCVRPISGAVTVTVVPLQTVTISGDITICPGGSATVTFTGTPNAIVNYRVNNSANQTIALNASGIATITNPYNVTTVFGLVNVAAPGTPSCIRTATGTATITVLKPTATISGNITICPNGSAVVTFTGTPNATVNYTVNSGSNQSIVLDGAGNAVLTNTYATTAIFNLVSVSTAGTPVCTQPATGTATVTVGLPTAIITGNNTILAGQSSTLTFYGTPNATVVFSSTPSLGPNVSVVLSAQGVGTYNIPYIATTTTFNLVSIATEATPLVPSCSATITGSAIITVTLNTCAVPLVTVDIDVPSTVCNPGDCIDLLAHYSNIGSPTDYVVSSIPYCPSFPFIGGTEINANCDDVWAPTVTLPFEFNFYGNCYRDVRVGSNGVITFNTTGWTPACLGLDYCPWSWGGTIPNAGFPIKNAIYGVYQDTDIGAGVVALDAIPDAIQKVNYYILNTGPNAAPNRVFVANFNELPQFSCHSNNGVQTSQIVLHETTNIIEVFVNKRTPCVSWQGGVGVIGVQNAAGSAAVAAPGRNGGAWTANNEAWRFYPKNQPLVPTKLTWLANGGPIGAVNENPLHVCPTSATTYTAVVEYDNCGITQITKDINIDIAAPLPVASPHDITICDTGSPYTVNIDENADILNGIPNPGDYIIKYYEDATDAANDAPTNINFNSDLDLQTFTFNTLPKTIYVRIEDLVTTGCANIRSFNILALVNPSGTFSYNTPICSNFVTAVPIIENTPLTTGGVFTASPAGLVLSANTGTISPGSAVGHYTVTYTITPAPPCLPFVTSTDVDIVPCGCTIIASSTAETLCKGTMLNSMTFTIAGGATNGSISSGSLPAGVTAALSAGTYTISGTPTLAGVYNFTVSLNNATDSCTKSVTITVNAQPNAGTNGSTTVCDSSTVGINLFSLLTGADTGGIWTRDVGGTGGTFDAATGTFTPAAGATTTTFTYSLAAIAPCVSATSQVTVTINPQPNAGANGSLTICDSTTTPINLFSVLTGTPQTGGVWTRNPGGTGGTFNAATGTFTPGAGTTTSVFTYTLTGTTPCVNATSEVTITINPVPNAGTGSTTTVCDSSTAAVNLFGLLTGAQTGGVWTRNPGGSGGTFDAVAGTFTPAPGATTTVFTYTIAGVAPCVTATSTVTVAINPQPNAGADGATTVCDNSTVAVNLFGLLTGAQSGGVWTRDATSTGGTFNAATGTFTPAVGATNSTFTYTLTGTAPCINDTSQVIVTINPQPNAGTDGAVTVCDNSATAIVLYSLLTGAQTGGVWTRDATSSGGTFNAATGTFTPASGATTSTFTYTLAGVAPCSNDTSQVVVTINPQPVAGTNGTATVCDSDTNAITLFGLLTGAQTGGVWTRDATSSGGLFNAATGTFTPAIGATTSVFTYTLTGTSPCVNASSTVTITINPQANAGTSGGTTICDSSTATINLFGLLTGAQIGGVWTRNPGGTGGTFNAAAGTFTPASGSTTTGFTYTITGVAPCPNVSSVATVNINPQPVAGTNGSTTVCDSSTTAINLFGLLTGAQTGGVWTRDLVSTGGTFNAATGTFTPAPGATSSTFTYTLIGTVPCVNASSVVTININPQPNAGTSGATTICESDSTTINLFNLITGEQIGGVWTRNPGGTGGTFNAAAGTFTPATGATASSFTYTLTGTAPCNNATSVATVNITPQPVAGTNGSTTVCDNSTVAINLSNLLTGQQTGGVWTRNPGGTGGTFNAAAGTFTPAPGASTSSFTYTVNATAPCIAVTNIATVNINPEPNAGTNGTKTVCDSDATVINLFNLLGGAQTGGVWTRNLGGTGGIFNAISGTFTPAPTATTSTFTYTLSGTAPCTNDTSSVTITIHPQPVAGMDGSITVCDSSTSVINLFNLIAGEQPGGVWTRTVGTGGTFNAAAGAYTPASGAVTSEFVYTLTGTAPCTVVTSKATVNINPQPVAGTSGTTAVCETDTTLVNLASVITGEQAGGVWTRTGGTGGTFDPLAGTFTSAPGATTSAFTYTLIGTVPCVNVSSIATVTVNPSASLIVTLGTANQTLCINTPIIKTVYTIGRGATGASIVSGGLPTGVTAVFNAANGTLTIEGSPSVPGTYTYQVATSGGCPGTPITGTIVVNPRVTMILESAASSAFQTPCLNTQIVTIRYHVGNGVVGVIASNLPPGLIPNFNSATNIFTITGTVLAVGTYNYTVTTVGGCGPDVMLIGTIDVRPSASIALLSGSANQTLCVNEPITSISYQIGTGATGAYLTAGTVPVGIQVSLSGDVFTISGTATEAGTFDYIITTTGGCGTATLTGRLIVYPLPSVSIDGGYICVDENGNPKPGATFILDTRLPAADYTFVWSDASGVISGASGNTYEASASGTYMVEVTSNVSGCSNAATVTVVPSFPPIQIGTVVSDYFADHQLISVSVVPPGVYEYQLDNGAFQDANQFVGFTSGYHTVNVRDKFNCGFLSTQVLVIDFPRFFTPNNDGYNDTWNIFDLKDFDPDATIYIFDRYGKYLKEISPLGDGWDGSSNNHQLPSTDYWFKVFYKDKGVPKEFKSHFSLKR